MSFITNYIQNTAMGLLSTGITAAGGVAGNAVGGVGTMIESGGRAAGDTVEGFVRKGGDFINGYGDKWVNATATQDGPIKKNAAKAPASSTRDTPKPSPSPANKGNAYTKTALPSASSKVKGLPAPLPSAAKPVTSGAKSATKSLPSTNGLPKPKGLPAPYGSTNSVSSNAKKDTKPAAANGTAGKIKISPESRPKPAGSGANVPKPPIGANAPKPPGPTAPKGPSPPGPKASNAKNVGAGPTGAGTGKVKISAESRPKAKK